MSLRGRRFAGMKLAVQPVQNVSQQLNDALTKLNSINVNETRGFPSDGFNETIAVPGTDTRVEIRASRTGLPNYSFDPSETTIIGNPDQIKLIADKNKGDVFSLAWSVDGSYDNDRSRNETPDERIKRVKIARAADRGFDKAIKGLPEGSLVENSPIGAGQGDFSRADIYMQKGFGPLQNDGLQYGLIENGLIRPVSPFVVNEEHAKHLAQRAEKGGNPLLATAITKEIDRRKLLNIDDVSPSKQPDYDDDYGYDDYDYEGPPPPLSREEFERSLQGAIATPTTALGRRDDHFPAGIGVRDRASRVFSDVDRVGRADDVTDEILAEGIRRVRERQVQDVAAGFNPAAGANMDLLEQLSPRRLPQAINANDLERMREDNTRGYGYRSSSVGVPNNTPVGERREAFINSVRNRMEQYPAGWDSDAGVVRDAAKRDLIDIYEVSPGGPVIAQQLFEPRDVESLRQWQANQHANWPLESFGREPAPPIIDTQGRAMGPAQFNQHPDAPADPTAWRGDRTNAQRRDERDRAIDPLLAEGREVQWRAAQPAQNYADAVAMRDVELTPSHMRVNVIMANDRLGAMVQNGTLPADTPRNVQAMQQAYGLQPNFDNLPQDLLRIRAFNGRGVPPSTFFDRDSAQALVNLNAAQHQSPDLLPNAVAAMGNQPQYNIGTAAPIRRPNAIQPFNPDYTNPVLAEREARSRRRPARPRPDAWESAPQPDPFTSAVRREMEGRAMQQADNIAPDPGWSLRTIRRVDPDTFRQDLDGISFSDLGTDAQRRLQQRSQSPVPSGLSLDEFLDYRADMTTGNTIAGPQPRASTGSGSNSAALARPENRIVRRRRQAAAANDWSTAPLVPDPDTIPF